MDKYKEIERKFLVETQDFKAFSHEKVNIVQGYLNSAPERCVRVRLYGEEAYICIKGISSENGTSRFEWEQKINKNEALRLLNLCESEPLKKTRYIVNYENHIFEIDEFAGLNAGLVIAEVELTHEDEFFAKPSWLGEEVTGDIRYYNVSLSKRPYTVWHDAFLFSAQ